MGYISKKINSKVVVWLKEENRYIIFHEPGFEIFKKLNEKHQKAALANWYSDHYGVDKELALKLVEHIAENLSQLKKANHKNSSGKKEYNIPGLISDKKFKTYSYKIFNKAFQFSYSGPWMKDMIHPGIAALETNELIGEAVQFYLLEEDEELLLITGKKEVLNWSIHEPQYFKGSIYMQLINVLYNKSDDFWMGAFHAGAVAKSNSAVLISAASGKGKSTLTALLAANGFQMISDDLVPISMDRQELYSLPLSISVKPGAFEVLKPLYPDLETSQLQYNSSTGKEVFHVNPKGKIQKQSAKVKAIIFPEYNAHVDFDWEQVDHLSVMDDFISESWIVNNEKGAQTFLDWFFTIPCFRLKYSDNDAAIKKIETFFK